ncbi:MAG: hypothetical protein ABIJ82_00550 [Patescibacteria group bacterium]
MNNFYDKKSKITLYLEIKEISGTISRFVNYITVKPRLDNKQGK